MNLSQFKKLKEDKKMVTMGHPAGHKITILKSKLSALHRKQLEQLPIHMADGGGVGEDAPTEEEVKSSQTMSPELMSAIQPPGSSKLVASTDPEAGLPLSSYSSSPIKQSTVSADQVAGDLKSTGEFQAPVVSPDPMAASAPVKPGFDLNAPIQQGHDAISAQEQAASQLAKNQAAIQQKYIQDKQDFEKDAVASAKIFQDNQQKFLNDYQNDHINPNHYQENMGTGQKVATAIGLILGGFSKGGENPAADWLNQQITRDIESQKNEQDKKKTIFSANQELYKDKVLAQNQTRINMNDIYDHKLQLEANKLGTPLAKAAALAQHAKWSMENAQLQQSSALRAAALRVAETGKGNPANLIDSFVPKEQHIEAYKELKDRQQLAGFKKSFDQSAKDLRSMTLGGIWSPHDAASARQAFTGAVQKVSEGRYNEKAAEQIATSLLPERGDTKSTMDNKDRRREQFFNSFAHSPILEGHNIPLDKFESTSMAPAPKFQPGQVVYKDGKKGIVGHDGQIRASRE